MTMYRIDSNRVPKIFTRPIFPLFILCIFGYILYSIEASELPDFEAYGVMFQSETTLGSGYVGFQAISLIFKYLGFGYQEFRYFTIIAGLVFIATVLKIGAISSLEFNQHIKSPIGTLFLFLILACVFVFEYYLIRLRAGIAMSFFAIFFYYWLRPYASIFGMLLGFLTLSFAFLASAAVHFETFVVIFLFFGIPFIWSKFIKISTSSSHFLYLLVCFGVWEALFWFAITDSLEGRGVDLASKLNPVRFIAIAIVPILIWFFIRKLYPGRRNGILRENYIPYLFAQNYIACAAALTTYYYLSSAVENAGEAIVRIMELASFGAVMSLAIGKLSYLNGLAVYLLIINSLFFLHTIYG